MSELAERRHEVPGIFPLSYSALSRHDECPLWYKFENIDRKGRKRMAAGDQGNALHEYAQIRVSEGAEKADSILSALVPLKDDQEFWKMKKLIDEVLVNSENLISLEERYNLDVLVPNTDAYRERTGWTGEIITVRYQSKLDVLFIDPSGIAEIVDYKSGRRLDAYIENDVQLKTYALIVLRNFPHVWKVVCRRVDLRFNRILTIEYTAAEIEEFSILFEAKIRALTEDGKFDPSPGEHCSWCPFVFECPAAQKMLPNKFMFGDEDKQLPVVINDETAEDIARGVRHLEVVVHRYKKMMQEFVERENRGILVDSTHGYDHRKHTTRFVKDTEGLREVLLKHNLDPRDFMSGKMRSLSPLLNPKKKDVYIPELVPTITVDEYSKFEYGNLTEGSDDD